MDRSEIKHLLCPNTEFLQDKLFVMNSYNSKDHRKSFELLITKCSNNTGINRCADDKQIQVLLKELVFSIYFVHKKVNLKSKIYHEPFEVQFSLYGQFMLNLNNYRDCNILITENRIYYKTNRLADLKTYTKKIYDLRLQPEWYSHDAYFNVMK